MEKVRQIIGIFIGCIVFVIFSTCHKESSLKPILTEGDIVFVGGDYYNTEIYLIDQNGENLVQLTYTSIGYQNEYPHWSPDGSKIVFNRFTGDGKYWGAYTIDVYGKEDLLLDYGGYPLFSPDGSKIAILYTPDTAQYGYLYVMDCGTGELKRISELYAGAFYSWSPDGEWLIFSEFSGDTISNLVRENINTNEKFILLEGLKPPEMLSPSSPVPSPDGSKILFSSTEIHYPGVNLYIINWDGTGLKRLTSFPFVSGAGTPMWSPDGSKIFFHLAADEDALYIINPDGTGLQKLFSWYQIIDFCLSPDGEKIIYTARKTNLWESSKLYMFDLKTSSSVEIARLEHKDILRIKWKGVFTYIW